MLDPDHNRPGLPSHSIAAERKTIPSLVDVATGAASALRFAEAKFDIVIKAITESLGVKEIDIISQRLEFWQQDSWLSNLVKSLGDPNQLHFAVHVVLDASSNKVAEAVRSAWGELFEIETRSLRRDEILLSLRPKGGREAAPEDRRLAVAQDICIGQRVYIMHGDFEVLLEQVITEVSDASADYKGFTANDGRRYGLDGSVFILNIDDVQAK